MLLEARGLGRGFAGVTALRDVDLRIQAGEAVAVLGPNGAGKSTLLRLCATSLRPTMGSLRLFGKEVREARLEVRRRIGFLSHQSFLYPDLSVAENLAFYAEMYGIADSTRRTGEWIERVGLVGWATRPVRTLSKGLEQRCALARALLHAPDLLLLDEPFNGLDQSAAEMLTLTLGDETARGTTVMMVTHDFERAVALCTRALVLRQGRLLADLEPMPATGEGLRASYEESLRVAATKVR